MYKKGFTLIELLVVIGIISVLVGMATFSFTNAQKKARDVKRKTDLRQIASAIELLKDDTRPPAYPTNTTSADDVGAGTYTSFSTCGATVVANGVTYMKLVSCDATNPTPKPYYYSPDNTTTPPTYELCACLESPSSVEAIAENDCDTQCGANYSEQCSTVGATYCLSVTQPN